MGLVRTGGGRGINPAAAVDGSEEGVAPRRTFHRVTNRRGGGVKGDDDDDDDFLEDFLGGMGMDSTEVTIHPFAAARQCCRGGRSVRVL